MKDFIMTFSFKKYIVQIACLLAVVTLFSCGEDEQDSYTPSPSLKAQIMLKFPDGDETTRASEAGSPDENRIKNLYLFVFDNLGNKEFEKYLEFPYSASSTDVDMSLWATEKVIILLDTDILSNLDAARNIHIVTNIPQSKLASISNEAALKSVVTNTITAEIAQPSESTPLVMHGICQAHVFTSNVRATVPLVRNVAKIRLKVNTTNSTLGANTVQFAPGNEIFVTGADITDRSYMVVGNGVNPTGTNYINYAAKTLTGESTGQGTARFDMPALYVNENVGDKVNPSDPVVLTPTYLVLQIPFNAGEGIQSDNYYKVQVNADNGFLINRNTIYDITVNIDALGGETSQTAPVIDATLTILPWDEKTLVSDMTQTYISVESTSLQVAGGEYNFQCSTNAEMSARSVTSDAPAWLSAAFDSQNNLKITALGTGYIVPRSATLTIKANDLAKVITINQEAVPVTDGSISLNPQTLYLSTNTPTRPVVLTVTNNAQWKNMAENTTIASYSPNSGTGSSTINFTRTSTAGNANFRFVNLNTLNYADVTVCNLSLTSTETEVQVPGAGAANETIDGIVALGGDANWRVKSRPSWVTVVNSGGVLTYSADAEPNELDREENLVLCHVNDENLTVTIKMSQSARYIMFPEFVYLVVRYTVGARPGGGTWDMDSSTFFRGTGLSTLDNYGVGYGIWASSTTTNVTYGGTPVMVFGGDNTQSGYETAYVDFKTLLEKIYDLLPRYFTIELYARWWNGYTANTNINVTMTLYNAGTMSKSGYDFVNSLGSAAEAMPPQNYTILLKVANTTVPISPSNFDKPQHLGTITYDKMKNRASLEIYDPPTTRSLASPSASIEYLPGETKDEYAKRVND